MGKRSAPPEDTAVADETTHHVTRLLADIEAGGGAVDELMPLVYAELRSAADRLMRRERGDHTLQPTALVHEVFVRLVEGEASLGKGRQHFLAIASRAMRNLLVDRARERRTEKRGGGAAPVTLSGLAEREGSVDVQLLDLHDALARLEELDPRQARIVEMSFFGGMTGDEIAAELDVHRNTVVRDLRMARAWLRRELGERE